MRFSNARSGFQPFGQNPSLAGTASAFRYTGRRLDPETAGTTSQPSGLYYYRARMYSPTWGRFLQADPIGYAGGDTNLYAYVRNNPIKYIDPFGTDAYVVEAGDEIRITVPIYFINNSENPNAVQDAIQSIQSRWSGQVGKYNINLMVEPINEQQFNSGDVVNRVTLQDTPTPQNSGHSYVINGLVGVWNTGDQTGAGVRIPGSVSRSVKRGATFAHETGHLLGLPDRPGDSGALMDQGRGTAVTPQDISDILGATQNGIVRGASGSGPSSWFGASSK